jgi:hypothetical protein
VLRIRVVIVIVFFSIEEWIVRNRKYEEEQFRSIYITLQKEENQVSLSVKFGVESPSCIYESLQHNLGGISNPRFDRISNSSIITYLVFRKFTIPLEQYSVNS